MAGTGPRFGAFRAMGRLIRNANGPGHGGRDKTEYWVPLYPNKVVVPPTRKATNPPPEGPPQPPGRGFCGVVVRC